MTNDRIEIFKQVSTDRKTESYNEEKFNSILDDNFINFCKLCVDILNDESVKDITCEIQSQGHILFTIVYEDSIKCVEY